MSLKRNLSVSRVAAIVGVLSASATLLLTGCGPETDTTSPRGAVDETSDAVREAGRNASSNFSASVDASLKTNRVLTEFERTNKSALDNAADSAPRAAEETGQAVKEGAKEVEEGAQDAANHTGEEIQKEADRAK